MAIVDEELAAAARMAERVVDHHAGIFRPRTSIWSGCASCARREPGVVRDNHDRNGPASR
jgi:hypothetical protein